MKKPVTITLNLIAIDLGKKDAKKLRRSFSDYIEILILENAEKKFVK